MRLVAITSALSMLLALPASAVEFPGKLAANSLALNLQSDRIYIDLDTGEALTEYQSRVSRPNFNTDPHTFSTDPPVRAERRLRKAETNQLKALLEATLEKGVDAPESCRSPDHRVIMLEASPGKFQFSRFVFCPLPETEHLISKVWEFTHSTPTSR